MRRILGRSVSPLVSHWDPNKALKLILKLRLPTLPRSRRNTLSAFGLVPKTLLIFFLKLYEALWSGYLIEDRFPMKERRTIWIPSSIFIGKFHSFDITRLDAIGGITSHGSSFMCVARLDLNEKCGFEWFFKSLGQPVHPVTHRRCTPILRGPGKRTI